MTRPRTGVHGGRVSIGHLRATSLSPCNPVSSIKTCIKILKILLEAGFSVESCLPSNLSPLHIAATFKHTRLVEMLLKAGANINSKTISICTPLDFAAIARRSNMVKFLLDAGADVISDIDDTCCSLDYALKRKPSKESLSIVTPLTFQNLLQITEMLLIAGVCELKRELSIAMLLIYASNIRVSCSNVESSSCFNVKRESNVGNVNKDKNNKEGEFRPEIVRCLLNYLQNDKLNESLNIVINAYFYKLHSPSDILDIILENYDSKSHIKVYNLNKDYYSNLHIISQTENVERLLFAVQRWPPIEHIGMDEWIDLLKMITARLVLLPSDQGLENMKLDLLKKYNLLNWQNECQQQIKSMKTTKLIDEFNVTFYDILSKPVDKVASYIRDEKLLNSLDSAYKKFPAYTEFLEICVRNGKQRIDLKDDCVKCMLHLIERNHKIQCSSDDIEEILQYLSVFDLRRLSAACSSLFSL